MRARRVAFVVSIAALAAVAVPAGPASAEGTPPPVCPWNSWLAFDWPNNTYVQVDPRLPLGCFSNWCPEGYSIVTPYADGSDPFSFEPPDYLKPWVKLGPWASSGLALSAAWDEGDVPPGCVLNAASKTPTPTPGNGTGTGTGTGTGGDVAGNVITNPGAAPAPVPVVSALIPATPAVVAGSTISNQAPANQPAAVAGTQLSGNLPRTGSTTQPAVVGGVLLAAVGGALVVAARRRRPSGEPTA